MTAQVNEALAVRIAGLLKHGLVRGLGTQEPGKMCVEAVVCAAMGLPHSDDPPCVGSKVRAHKIILNDARWSSNLARAEGMAEYAIAQLGSDTIDQDEFVRIVVEQTIRQILPIALRSAAQQCPVRAASLKSAARRCESEGTARAADAAARAAADAAAYAAAAADARAAAYAAADAAAYAAADAAARAAARTADAAARAAAYAANAIRCDHVLRLAAKIAVDALKAVGSPGCAYLHVVQK